jgi:predicted phage-related endonuclease
MTMEILSLQQGSPEWHQHRATAYNASDAPSMLACSPYKNRSDFVRERATGITAEVTPAQQRIFDDGHRFEALARPLAEAIIGEELSPCVGKRGKYSASFDGLTFMGDVAFEHKALGNSLRDAMTLDCTGADLPLHYRAQMEQQAMVSGCERILFMASTWDAEDNLIEERHCWYEPDAELRAQIIAGWEQFEKDVAAYAPQEAAAPVVATPTESLPAVVVQVQGALTVAGNLPAFGDALRAFIARIPQRPGTDQEFADADAACKALKKAEDALAQAEDSALAQIGDVELMRRTVADLKTLARNTRLATEKLVKAEKDARRAEKVMAARTAYQEHVMRLQQDCSGVVLDVQTPDFAATIKGLSSLASIDDKLTAALIDGKAKANTVAGRVVNNLKAIASVPQYAFLFPDRQELAHKDAEVLELLMHKRVTDHQAAEQQRQEAERERIRQEEAARADREAREKLEAEQRAAQADIAQAAQTGTLAVPVAADLGTLVQEKHAEAVAGLDAQQVIGTAQRAAAAGPAVVPLRTAAPAERTGTPTLKLGAIADRLGFALSANFLRSLGFEPADKVGAHGVYHEADFPLMLAALVRHIEGVQEKAAA